MRRDDRSLPPISSPPAPAAGAPDPPVRADPHIARVRALTRLLDDAVGVPGTRLRFGLDPLLGLVPGAGDVAGALLSTYVLLVAARHGAPRSVLLRMLANIGIDGMVGTIPVVGDLFDVGWKANRRNLTLLERHLAAPGEARRASRGFFVMLVLLLVLLVAGAVALGVLVVWAISGARH
jgi:hypothetical protein